MAEYLATNPRGRPKTLFATHYHELTDLADALPGVVNAHVAAREWQEDIVFLHKIVPGRSDRSYGIQVARLAGMPAPVIVRARAILQALERDELTRGGRPSISGTPAEPQQQLGLFQAGAPRAADSSHRVARRLGDIDTNGMTPLQALSLLEELKARLDALYGGRIRALVLYGSYARHDAREGSDLDVAVVLEDFERAWLEIERTGPVVADLSLRYGITISLLPVRKVDWELGRTLLARSLHREGVAVT